MDRDVAERQVKSILEEYRTQFGGWATVSFVAELRDWAWQGRNLGTQHLFTCPGCGRPTALIMNHANCPACMGED